MDKRDDILAKIRKCMDLAKSGGEHEAAAALRQAQRLMEMHQVSSAEMLAAGVGESRAKSGAVARPAKWESGLAGRVAGAFGCKLIFIRSYWDLAHWLFVGVAPANEIAAYSFEVLLRQALKARGEFIATTLKRIKKSNKTRRADLFSESWVYAACANVAAPTPPEGAESAIDAHMQLHHPSLGELDVADRNAGRNLSAKDEAAWVAGRLSGRGARLHAGVATTTNLMLEG